MRYQVDWYDDFGVKRGVIQAFTKLEYVRTENAIGRLVLTLPRGLYRYEDFKVGDILEVWRDKTGSLELQNEAAYFVQDWHFFTDAQGAEYIEVVATDANWLLDTAIVIANAGSAVASKTAIPDDMMKSIVDEQLGAAAAAGRGKVTVAPNVSAGGASITKDFAFRNVLKVLTELAEQANEGGVYLVFDVVRTTPGVFEFRTYTGQRGQDHGRSSGDPRLVGKQYGNLAQSSFGTFHAAERNFVVVGGQGEEVTRTLVYRWNYLRWTASKWNRRELFVDARDLEVTAALEAEGDAALNEFKPKQVMTGTLYDTPGMQYNVHYGFGDIVDVEAFGYHIDCHVSSVHVTVNQDNGEQIDVKLRGEM